MNVIFLHVDKEKDSHNELGKQQKTTQGNWKLQKKANFAQVPAVAAVVAQQWKAPKKMSKNAKDKSFDFC